MRSKPIPRCETCAHWKPVARRSCAYSAVVPVDGYCTRECAPTSNTGHCAAHRTEKRTRIEVTP